MKLILTVSNFRKNVLALESTYGSCGGHVIYTVFWDVTPQLSLVVTLYAFRTEDGGSRFIRNISICLPKYTASHSRW